MFLFVGLGNIGDEYQNTRHNVGFITVNNIIDQYTFSIQGKKFHSEIFSGIINSEKGLIIKPQTYMNRSGIAVSEISRFYKIATQDIYVFHDDMDLELGRVKCKIGGGSAGHNGIKSIDEMVGKNYNRVRIGIGRPKFNDDTINFVLGKFAKNERITIDTVCDRIARNIDYLLTNRDLFLTNIMKK